MILYIAYPNAARIPQKNAAAGNVTFPDMIPDTKAQPVMARRTAVSFLPEIRSPNTGTAMTVTNTGDVYRRTAAAAIEDFSMAIP